MPLVNSLLRSIAQPLALARDGKISHANDALSELLGGDPTGRSVAELALLEGVALHQSPLADGSTLCSFVRTDLRVEELLDVLGAEGASRLLLSQRDDPVSITDMVTKRFVDVNEAWCAQYGYSREEAVGKLGPSDVSAEPDATRAALTSRAAAKGIGAPDLRWHRRRDGSVFPVEVQCGSLRVRGRDLVYARLRDVEERVRAEEAIRRSEENYRTLIEHLPYAVVVHRAGRLLYVNPAGRRLLGFAPEEAIEGLSLYELVHPDDRALVTARVQDRLYRGTTAPLNEERLVRRDGTVIQVEVIGIPTLFDGEPAGLALAQDIGARKEMEARLVASDRLAALGRLAASIGHEINNPLMYVLGSLELLRQDLTEAGMTSLLERVDAAEQGTLRVRDVVRDLRTLARSPSEDHGPAELAHTVEACIKMASHELRHRARVVREYPPEPVWAYGSDARLGQVFLNLIVNAAQSIDEGKIHENEVRVRVRSSGSEAIVEVIDTGHGIPPAVEAHLFEAFFTTKRGTGMGLGLPICHQIVTALGGSIEVERRERGTLLRVRLPRAEPPAPAPLAREMPPDLAACRVLVVDDEPQILALLRDWLSGFDVHTADSGREALERVEREGPFDAIVCDLMMGDLTGMDVHAELARRGAPEAARCVFATGGAYTERAREFLEQLGTSPLHKPFRKEEVLEAVRRVLSSAP